MDALVKSLRPAPKDYRENVAYRRAILARAAEDGDFKEECWIRASRDIVWFSDSLLWTYSPKDHPEFPERLFVLWDFQEDAVRRINGAIDGKHDILVEKSRDMGASWMILLVLFWRWLFRRHQSFLLVSRKEDLVDRTGDPDSLFWKLDFMLDKLPGWLVPHHSRIKMGYHNESNGSVINGESANEDLSRGGRRTTIMLDEAAAIDNGYSVMSATRGATNCRISNSTPRGASGAFYDRREALLKDAPERVLRLHWTLHPKCRPGLYTTEGNCDGGRLVILDRGFEFAQGYRFVLDGKVRSPWYDEECSRAASPQEIATELDIDYAASGWPFFDRKILDALIERHCLKPFHRGELFNSGAEAEWLEQSGARLKLWINLDPRTNKLADANRQYVVSCDIASGKGGEMSSNSVASVVDKLTGEKVAEFATNQMIPFDFCDYVLLMCRWFNEAFLIWEENGPGGEFTKRLKESRYRNIFYREDESKFVTKKSKKPGWWTQKDNKRALLSSYLSALITGKFINRSEEALREAGEYVHEPNGEIVHARAKDSPDPTVIGAEHGDRVIADALAYRALDEVVAADQAVEAIVPINSFMGRRLAAQRGAREAIYY